MARTSPSPQSQAYRKTFSSSVASSVSLKHWGNASLDRSKEAWEGEGGGEKKSHN